MHLGKLTTRVTDACRTFPMLLLFISINVTTAKVPLRLPAVLSFHLTKDFKNHRQTLNYAN